MAMGNNPINRVDPNGGHDSYRDARLEKKRIKKEIGRKAFRKKYGKVRIRMDEMGEYYLESKGGYEQYEVGDEFVKIEVGEMLQGGSFDDGVNVDRLRVGESYYTFPRRNYLNPMAFDKFSINYYDNKALGQEIARVLGHLEIPQNISGSIAVGNTGIGVAAHLKGLKTNPASIYVSATATLLSAAIEVDKKTLQVVATNYLIHGTNSGVYSIYHFNGSKVTYEFYDAGNNMYLGGVKQGSFGF